MITHHKIIENSLKMKSFLFFDHNLILFKIFLFFYFSSLQMRVLLTHDQHSPNMLRQSLMLIILFLCLKAKSKNQLSNIYGRRVLSVGDDVCCVP